MFLEKLILLPQMKRPGCLGRAIVHLGERENGAYELAAFLSSIQGAFVIL
jgi:hypothetical protein